MRSMDQDACNPFRDSKVMTIMSTSWSIKKSISLGFACLLGCMGCMAGISANRMLHVLSVQREHAEGLLPAATLANDFQREMLNARISLIYFVTIQKPGSRDLGMKHLDTAETALSALTTLVEHRNELSDLQPIVNNLNGELANYKVELAKTIKLVEGGTTSGDIYNAQVKVWASCGGVLVGDADKTQALSSQMSDKRNQTNIDSLHSTVTLCVTVFLASFVGCIALAAAIVRKLNNSLREITDALDTSSQQIAASSFQIASSSQAMAQSASEQAATIEETSAASTEINSMAQRTKEHSSATAEIVSSAHAGCEKTNTSLAEMGKAMEAIHVSSQRVSQIVKVIDEIAFQTNILALNASVEAARAGAQGAGFAVVADEVRSLAQRCASAARDTTQLVDESMERSKGGRQRMQTVVTDMQTVTHESQRIRSLIEEIRNGSIEQSRGVDQINRAISQMEQVTQGSAAQAEQGAASASELSSQAVTMKEIVVRLKVLVEGKD